MLEKTKRDPLLHQQHQKESFFIADALGFALHLHLLFLSTRTEVDQNYIKKQLWMGVPHWGKTQLFIQKFLGIRCLKKM